MRDHQDDRVEVPEADALEQRRDVHEEPHDPEQSVTGPEPEVAAQQLEADPADVAEQSIDVPLDDEEHEQP
ncbi:hypothetical protein [Microbacterium sp. USHLN186]|uniref:hypothetical protein n=1 Tax=Microbacterium sp. USHLN186 TaxID=3081286 RepID=UPI00301984B5